MAEKIKDGRHCDLCGCSGPVVRCDKCNGQIFCLSCDDMYHRHPKRRFHLRKAVDGMPSGFTLRSPSGIKPTAPGDPSKMPIPPPRKKKGRSFFSGLDRGFSGNEVHIKLPPIRLHINLVSLPSQIPALPKKEFSLTEKIGSIKRFMTNRPLPPIPKTENERMQYKPRAESPKSSEIRKKELIENGGERHPRVQSPQYQNLLTHLTKMAGNSTDEWEDSHSASGSTRGSSSVGDDSGSGWGQDIRHMNALVNPPPVQPRGPVGNQESWHNSVQGFGTLRRTHHPQHEFAMHSMAPSNSRGMHHSASVSDLSSIPRSGPPSPQSPFMPYPYPPGFLPSFAPFAPVQSVGHLNHPHGYAGSWHDLNEDARRYDGNVNTLTRDSRRQHQTETLMKRSQSVMYDPMTMPGPYFPFGGIPPAYPPYPYWAYQHHLSTPPSPTSSVRSLSRLGRPQRRYRDEESETSSLGSSRRGRGRKSAQEKPHPKSSSDDNDEAEEPADGRRELNESRAGDFSESSESEKETSDSPIPPASTEIPSQPWECRFCTFVNQAGTRVCSICCKTITVQSLTSSGKEKKKFIQTIPPKANTKTDKPDGNIEITDEMVKQQLEIEKEIRKQINQKQQKSNEESPGVPQASTDRLSAEEVPENSVSTTSSNSHRHSSSTNSDLIQYSIHSQTSPTQVHKTSSTETSCQTNGNETQSYAKTSTTSNIAKDPKSIDSKSIERTVLLKVNSSSERETSSIALDTDDLSNLAAKIETSNLDAKLNKESSGTKTMSVCVETEDLKVKNVGAMTSVASGPEDMRTGNGAKFSTVALDTKDTCDFNNGTTRKMSSVASETDDEKHKPKSEISGVKKKTVGAGSEAKETLESRNRVLKRMSSVASGTDDFHEISNGHAVRGSSIDRMSQSSQNIYTQTSFSPDRRLHRSLSQSSLRGDAFYSGLKENRYNHDPDFHYSGGPFYRSSSRASLISEPGFFPHRENSYSKQHGSDRYGKKSGPYDKIPPQFMERLHNKPRMTNGWGGDKLGSKKQNFYLSMEELVERRRLETMRAQGLELVRSIRKAEQAGFMADDLQVAMNHCGKQDPVDWLEENWKNMIETVVTLATNFGHDKPDNDVGIVSVSEAKDALRLHKGNVWAAVTECVETRQRKYIELSAMLKNSRREIIASLTANQGDMDATYSELTKQSYKPFMMHVWGPGSGIENNDLPSASDLDDIPDSASTMGAWLVNRTNRHSENPFHRRNTLTANYPFGSLSRFPPNGDRRFSYSSEFTSELASSFASPPNRMHAVPNNDFRLALLDNLENDITDGIATSSGSDDAYSTERSRLRSKRDIASREASFKQKRKFNRPKVLDNGNTAFEVYKITKSAGEGNDEPHFKDRKQENQLIHETHSTKRHKINSEINKHTENELQNEGTYLGDHLKSQVKDRGHISEHIEIKIDQKDIVQQQKEIQPVSVNKNEKTQSRKETSNFLNKLAALRKKDSKSISPELHSNTHFQEEEISNRQDESAVIPMYENVERKITATEKKPKAKGFLSRIASACRSKTNSVSNSFPTSLPASDDVPLRYSNEVDIRSEALASETASSIEKVEAYLQNISDTSPGTIKKKPGVLKRLGLQKSLNETGKTSVGNPDMLIYTATIATDPNVQSTNNFTNGHIVQDETNNSLSLTKYLPSYKTSGSMSRQNETGKNSTTISTIENSNELINDRNVTSSSINLCPGTKLNADNQHESFMTENRKPGIEKQTLRDYSGAEFGTENGVVAIKHAENPVLVSVCLVKGNMSQQNDVDNELANASTTEDLNELMNDKNAPVLKDNIFPAININRDDLSASNEINENKEIVYKITHESSGTELGSENGVIAMKHTDEACNVPIQLHQIESVSVIKALEKNINDDGFRKDKGLVLSNPSNCNDDLAYANAKSMEASNTSNILNVNGDVTETLSIPSGGTVTRRREYREKSEDSEGSSVEALSQNIFRRDRIRRRPSLKSQGSKTKTGTENLIAIKRPEDNRTLQLLKSLPKRRRSVSRDRISQPKSPVTTENVRETVGNEKTETENSSTAPNSGIINKTEKVEQVHHAENNKTMENKATAKKLPSPVVGTKRLALDKQIKELLSEGKCETYEKAEIAAKLLEMKFTEKEALQAAKECPSIYQAISFLQQDCELCAGKFPMAEMVSMVNCIHLACRDCLRAYFTIQIRDRNILELLCPFCSEPDLTDEDIAADYFNNMDLILKNLVDAEIHELFHRKVRDRVLMKDPNFRWCSQCSSGFIIINPNQKRLLCPDCKAVTCASCRKAWEKQHEGITCEQFQEWKDANDPEVQAAGLAKHLQENGIDCPNCHFRYALAKGGCMHFKCLQCQYDFCCGCNKPFKMGQKCGLSNYCSKLGLHAHHPRNCLFYLRDKDPTELQKLLEDNSIQFNTELPDGIEITERCPVMEQKEVFLGLRDDICGRDVLEGYAGLCRLHYLEYLGGLVKRHRLDPLPIFDNDELEMVLRRASKTLPPKFSNDTDIQYRAKLLKIIEEEIPLDHEDKIS